MCRQLGYENGTAVVPYYDGDGVVVQAPWGPGVGPLLMVRQGGRICA